MTASLFAGNPDRQGEAGAYELLINPWARSAGLHTMTTACIRGVEALQLNPAGIARVSKTEIGLSNTQYLVGTGIQVNAFGLGQKITKNGVLGISLNLVNFGDIERTTVESPEGGIGTFSPSFFNLGISYGYIFANKISVGATVRMVTEALADVSARATALDAGVQYVTGDARHDDKFKFGISLRNVGSRMTFRGQGLSIPRPNPDGTFNYNLNFYQRGASYELPSQLNIGMSYDVYFGSATAENRLTFVGNFVSNAFGRDNLGGGLEFALGQNFALRGGYKYEFGTSVSDADTSIDSGIAAGATVSLPFKKGSDSRMNLDYAWRKTTRWDGIHNVSLRIGL